MLAVNEKSIDLRGFPKSKRSSGMNTPKIGPGAKTFFMALVLKLLSFGVLGSKATGKFRLLDSLFC